MGIAIEPRDRPISISSPAPLREVCPEDAVYGLAGRTVADGRMVALVDTHSCLVGGQFPAPATQHFSVCSEHVLRCTIVLHVSTPTTARIPSVQTGRENSFGDRTLTLMEVRAD